METKEKPRTTGDIVSLYLDITEPLKFDKMTLELRKMVMMTGINGSGKTLVLTLNWCMSYITQSLIFLRNEEDRAKHTNDMCQYIMDHSFTDQKINGTLRSTFASGVEMEMVLENGKVVTVKHQGIEDVDTPTPVVFLSAQMRTFSAIQMYLKFRKTLGSTDIRTIVSVMTEEFKIYDVMRVESLIAKMPATVTPELKKSLEQFDINEDITSFGVDFDICDFYAVIDDKRKYLSTYGNGHQALFNMMLAI